MAPLAPTIDAVACPELVVVKLILLVSSVLPAPAEFFTVRETSPPSFDFTMLTLSLVVSVPATLAPAVLVFTVNTAVPSACDTSKAFASLEPGMISTLLVANFIPNVVPLSPSFTLTKVLSLPPPSLST